MQKRQRTTSYVFCVAMILAACTTRAPLPTPLPPEPQTEQHDKRPADRPMPSVPKLPLPPKPPAAATRMLPQSFVGLSKAEVTTILGENREESERQPGQVWAYHAGSCAIELLFLLDVTRNDRFVADWWVTGPDVTPQSQQRCLQRFESRRGK